MITTKQRKPIADNPIFKKGVPKPISENACKYKNRTCFQPALDNYDYCQKHILEDKDAPYRPCSFTYTTNNKRCFKPAFKFENFEESYCPLHLWQTQIKVNRPAWKPVPPRTPEFLLSGLSHYVKPVRSGIKEEDSIGTSRNYAINPFVEVDINKAAQSRSSLLECVSESDSDVEPSSLDNLWSGANEDTSEAESVDSEHEDPLKYAGHYTPEEVCHILKTKMITLQSMYQQQFERLQYLYCEKKKNYLLALKKEKESLTSIHNQARTSVKEQKLYEKLRAMKRYHRRSKGEALAYHSLLTKRLREQKGNDYKPPQLPKCTYTEGGVRCSTPIIPLTKFCLKHILEDSNQCLFKECGIVEADLPCRVPVIGIGPDEVCLYHVRLPTYHHSSYPDFGMEVNGDKKSNDGSAIDESATESAFSTDQRDSPENSIRHRDEEPDLFIDKNSFPEADLQESIIEETVNDYEKVDTKGVDPLDDASL